jgi:ABC-type multidrug transport system ATPase subunit
MNATDGEALALEVRGLRRSFRVALGLRSVEVLHGIDLELGAGKFLGLVGPNGSGKSTLLRVLAGIDAASSGTLRVLGGDPESSAIKRRVGFLPEDSPFPREMRAAAVLDMLGAIYDMPRGERRERGEHLLERVGLGHARRTPLGRFSRGMLRRFGLAQAVLHEPDLILLDEPTAGLDALGFEVVDELLSEARARGAALVVSSHQLTDLHRHCDLLGVLIDGHLRAHGAPLELVRELGPSAQLDVSLAGADERALGAVRAAAEGSGAQWIGAGPAQANLLALYRRFGAERKP